MQQVVLTLSMLTGRPKRSLELSAEEEAELRGFSSSRSLPHALVTRAKLVLLSAEGRSNTEIAAQLNWTNATVGKWRQRFIERRLSGLYDELRPGRPRSVSDEKVAFLLRRTLKNKPPAGSHWSVARQPRATGFQNPRYIECSERSPSSRTAARASSCPLIRSLLRRCAMWWVFI